MKTIWRFLGRGAARLVALTVCILALVNPLGGHVTRAASTTTITWLVRTDPTVNPWERTTIQAFEQLHPNIHIQLVISPPSSAYDQKFLTMVAAGDPPSVFSNWGADGWGDFVYRGLVADLTPYIKASGFSFEGMDTQDLQSVSLNGHVYGIPFASGGSYVFYNADLFKAAHLPLPPTNWNDRSWNGAAVLKDAEALTKNFTNPSKAVWGIYDNLYPENVNAWLFGGDIFPASAYRNGVIDKVTATSPAVEQAVQWQSDMIHKYKVALNPAETSAVSASGDPFLTGRVGMEMTGIWGFWNFVPAKFKWGVAPLPYIKTDKDAVFIDPWMMSKNGKNPQAAWTFLEYLASPQHGAKTYVGAAGVYPVWKQLVPYWAQMMSKRTVLSVQQLEQLGSGSVKKGQYSMDHRGINYGEFNSTISNVLAPVWTGSTPSQSALSELQTRLTQIIKQANVRPGGYGSQP